MSNARKVQLGSALIMGAMMIFVMIFVVTWVNIGFGPDFLLGWLKSYAVAYVVGVPLIFFLAPVARGIAMRLLGIEP